MLAQKVESPPVTPVAHRASFFRQSGWLMIANIGGGMLMWVVHLLAHITGPGEYGVFIAMLGLAMCIPTMPLQMVFAQQTAKALATNRHGELSGFIRLLLLGTIMVWLGAVLVVFLLQGKIIEHWKIAHPAALWITMLVLLFSLWVPIFSGVLQGQQNFLWLGWSALMNGIGRVLVAAAAVLTLGVVAKRVHLDQLPVLRGAFRLLAAGGYATGMMTGVLVGILLAVGLAIWQTRPLWAARPLTFDWKPLLRQVIPLMLGFGAFQFLFTADTLFGKNYLDTETFGYYGAAGTLSRALMWLVGPLATVMFPRIVHSAARQEKSDLMNLVLLGTAILAVAGAVSLSVLAPWVVRFMSGKDFVQVASAIIPWYAGAMVPLAVANVLLNNLLARSQFKFVPGLCVLAVGYAFALARLHDNQPETLLKIMGVSNSLLFLLCAWFTWGSKARPSTGETRSVGQM
jgi:O-antigen/teichoic acid export membrane protein